MIWESSELSFVGKINRGINRAFLQCYLNALRWGWGWGSRDRKCNHNQTCKHQCCVHEILRTSRALPSSSSAKFYFQIWIVFRLKWLKVVSSGLSCFIKCYKLKQMSMNTVLPWCFIGHSVGQRCQLWSFHDETRMAVDFGAVALPLCISRNCLYFNFMLIWGDSGGNQPLYPIPRCSVLESHCCLFQRVELVSRGWC